METVKGKNVFFGLSGGIGPVLRTLPIAEEFRQAGAEVYFSIYDPNAEKLIEEAGFKVLVDDDPTFPEKMLPSGSVFYNMDHYFAQAGLLDEKFLEAWVRHRIRMLKRCAADLVFADMSIHTIIAAKHLGLPVVNITQSCFHPQGERVYSWGEPPRNITMVAPIVNRLLTRLGVPAVRTMEELNKGTIDVVPGIPEMDPISGTDVHFVGPIEHRLRGNRTSKSVDGAAYVLVYAGRMKDSAGESGLRLLRTVLEAFSGKRERVVIATGEKLPKEWKKLITKNVSVVPSFSPEMLANSRLFVHHGGHGSCLSGIMHGVSSLVIPTHTEREFNARKIRALGVGDYMIPDTFTAEHFYGMCRYMMQDAETQETVAELRNTIRDRKYGGARNVFELCLPLLGAGVARSGGRA